MLICGYHLICQTYADCCPVRSTTTPCGTVGTKYKCGKPSSSQLPPLPGPSLVYWHMALASWMVLVGSLAGGGCTSTYHDRLRSTIANKRC